MPNILSAFTVLITAQLVAADLPVHCLRHQVVGNWEFTLGPLGPKRSSCGHTKPDNPYRQPHMKFLEKMGPLSKHRMTLQDPNIVVSEDGSSGTWTMIYDEGFEVAMGNTVFFAFSKFSFTDADRQHNISHCDQTQIGWYHDTLRSRWGCYVGKKVTANADDEHSPQSGAAQGKVDKVAQAFTALQAFGAASASSSEEERKRKRTQLLTSWLDSPDQMAMAPDESSSSASAPAKDEQNTDAKALASASAGFDKPMEPTWQQSVAIALNFLQMGWTAQAYDQFQGKTPRELNRYAGVRRSHLHRQEAKQSFQATSFLGIASKVHHASFMDENLDWRKKDGKNWLTPVVTQGDCGSCYTIATVHMLTARNRINSGSTSEPSFSVSFPLYCSEYNQGCDGGYGFLQSKWIEDVGLIPESCAPFSQGGGSCGVTSGCKLGSKRYRASHHHYVGGYYGGGDANSIQKDLVEQGPLVVSFEPKEDFMYYKSGVYRSGAEKIHQEWEQVDHAVLLVGYGVDKNQKYWTMQNSWGTDWGEDGYFRMDRGNDESCVESIAVSANVVQESSNAILDDFIAAL
jgi:cathepsin C